MPIIELLTHPAREYLMAVGTAGAIAEAEERVYQQERAEKEAEQQRRHTSRVAGRKRR